jgi:putative oxygen-independent coproporphyrinogen III oxidase
MPSAIPAGDPMPVDGSLPESALDALAGGSFGIYLHVPFCSTRCGYCDFNTYTAAELGDQPGASRAGYISSAIAELDLAARALGPGVPPVSTIFVGGGTPTLLSPDQLGGFVQAVADRFGLTPDAEITTESNPESVDASSLARLAEQAFNRISFGMQSAVPHVLAVLDRIHSAGRPQQAVQEAKAAGFTQISLDLIYGTPGESLDDWRASLEAAISANPQHLSAYALIVEDGTRLASRIRRGELPAPDDDDLADKYLLAEERLSGAGFQWYEVSNWAQSTAAHCRHNLAYWRSSNWWGVGPGAHSHVGGTRWWNVKHPATYASRLAAGVTPSHAGEHVSATQQHTERVLLQLRLAEGLDTALLSVSERTRLPDLIARGLVQCHANRVTLTLEGRLLADAVTRDLLDD